MNAWSLKKCALRSVRVDVNMWGTDHSGTDRL